MILIDCCIFVLRNAYIFTYSVIYTRTRIARKPFGKDRASGGRQPALMNL